MTRRTILVAVLVSVVLVALAGGLVFVIVTVSDNQFADSQALCALRGDLQTRASSGAQFLLSHPHGIPGISARTIRVSVENEQHTIHALRFVKCPPGT